MQDVYVQLDVTAPRSFLESALVTKVVPTTHVSIDEYQFTLNLFEDSLKESTAHLVTTLVMDGEIQSSRLSLAPSNVGLVVETLLMHNFDVSLNEAAYPYDEKTVAVTLRNDHHPNEKDALRIFCNQGQRLSYRVQSIDLNADHSGDILTFKVSRQRHGAGRFFEGEVPISQMDALIKRVEPIKKLDYVGFEIPRRLINGDGYFSS